MTETIEATTADTGVPEVTGAELVHLDPAQIIIGTNVRTDLPDAKAFRKSIKERGVLEAVTVYRDEDGTYVCLRGQRRTVEAASVGTPTGTIPARVVPKPAEADRIGDQMVENIHRASMKEAEVLAGVEQLTLLGVSAAQIAKRTSIDRPTVDAAVAVTKGEKARERVQSGDLTLEEAAIFAEFEEDPDAIARLERRMGWGGSLAHEAQQLRDAAAERDRYEAEAEPLRAEGMPVLDAKEAEDFRFATPASRMLTAEGSPVSEDDWPTIPGAAVVLIEQWVTPEAADADETADPSDIDATDGDEEDQAETPERVRAYVPTWVITDPEAAAEAGFSKPNLYGKPSSTGPETEDQAEARRAERRRVIANNKAWVSAETVRRQWLQSFIARKTTPKGAEQLICEAVLTGRHDLRRAFEMSHPLLRELHRANGAKARNFAADEVAHIAAKASTPKSATMATLAAVVTAWEESTSKNTWRGPSAWDARVLGALVGWGYTPSDVERIVLGEEPAPDSDDATIDDPDDHASDPADDADEEPDADDA